MLTPPRRLGAKLVLTGALLWSSISFAESWNWQAYQRGVEGAPGYVVLNESSAGVGTIQFFAGRLTPCLSRSLNSTIVRTAETITITTEPAFNGCFEVKLTIKADGTGGTRETRANKESRWRMESTNQILTKRD